MQSSLIQSVKPFKEPPGRVRWLEPEEFAGLMRELPGWLCPIAKVAANTGMRRGEICNLRWASIDKRNRLIRLSKTKNGEARAVPMNKTVWNLVQGLPRRIDTPYLFANEDGSPVSAPRVTVEFKRACRRANIKNFRFHDLKHHFASLLTMAGQNQRTLMALLGHKRPEMTVRYQHLVEEHLFKAVCVLDEVEVALEGASSKKED